MQREFTAAGQWVARRKNGKQRFLAEEDEVDIRRIFVAVRWRYVMSEKHWTRCRARPDNRAMNIEEAKAFVKQHFEDFVNKQDLSVADRNFSPDYREHGADVPQGLPDGPEGPKVYLAAAFKKYPDIHVTIEDIVAEGDKVVVRNTWRATDSGTGQKIEFAGIVIWRIVDGKLAERWAYLQAPHQVH